MTSQANNLLQVPDERAGQRLDNFLQRELKTVTRNQIYKLLRTGQVRVNHGRKKPDYRIQSGDVVRVPPVLRDETGAALLVPQALMRDLRETVIHEDQDLLVLNKPSGLAVHAGSGLKYGLIEALRKARPDLSYVELAHRLDRETSGCLLLAKNMDALRSLQALFVNSDIEKKYLALVKGHWQETKTLTHNLAKVATDNDERRVAVVEDGKEAISTFKPIQRYANTTLMEVTIATGRTHQIRVQAATMGYPLVGDTKYGDSTFNAQMKTHGLNRLFLHSQSLAFTLPFSNREYHLHAELEESLKRFLTGLEA